VHHHYDNLCRLISVNDIRKGMCEFRYNPLDRLIAARGAGRKVVTEYRCDCQSPIE